MGGDVEDVLDDGRRRGVGSCFSTANDETSHEVRFEDGSLFPRS